MKSKGLCTECPCFEDTAKEPVDFSSEMLRATRYVCHLENAKTVIYDPDTWWCWDGRRIMAAEAKKTIREERDNRLKAESVQRRDKGRKKVERSWPFSKPLEDL